MFKLFLEEERINPYGMYTGKTTHFSCGVTLLQYGILMPFNINMKHNYVNTLLLKYYVVTIDINSLSNSHYRISLITQANLNLALVTCHVTL